MFTISYSLPFGPFDNSICQNSETFETARDVATVIASKKREFPRIVCILKSNIAESKRTEPPRYGITADGYTVRSGAPTSTMIRLKGEKRWRRVMLWQFSNAGTIFVRIGGCPVILDEYDIPEPRGACTNS